MTRFPIGCRERAVRRMARQFALLVFGIGLGLAFPCRADDPPKPKPEIKSSSPLWLPFGKVTIVTIRGQDLTPKSIVFDDKRIPSKIVKTEKLDPKDDKEKAKGNTAVTIEVSPPEGLSSASYKYTILNDGGAKATGSLYFDLAMPEIDEKEPNDTLAKPQVLDAAPLSIRGNLDRDGVDVFGIRGKAGERWRFEIVAHRAGSTLEPILRLRDPRRAPVKICIDQGNDCAIEYTMKLDGLYLLELFDGDNRTGAELTYRLSIKRMSSPGLGG